MCSFFVYSVGLNLGFSFSDYPSSGIFREKKTKYSSRFLFFLRISRNIDLEIFSSSSGYACLDLFNLIGVYALWKSMNTKSVIDWFIGSQLVKPGS